jgi:hypothetical protein
MMNVGFVFGLVDKQTKGMYACIVSMWCVADCGRLLGTSFGLARL